MAFADNPGGWLTAKRLRAHGAILVVCLSSVYIWNLATPGLRDRNGNLKGTDFLHFYTLGSLAAEHRGSDLYDMNAQAVLATDRVPGANGIRYLPLYPPQVSILFAPLARLPYSWALVVWWISSASLYSVCCFAIWRACPNLRDHGGTVAVLAAAFPPFFHLITWGQTSALALACLTLMFFLLRSGDDFLAGLVLGCLIFKPQLGFAAAIVFVSVRAWKVAVGAALSAAGQLMTGIVYYGVEPFRSWIHVLQNLRSLLPFLEPKPYQTHSLRTFWSLLLPWHSISFALYVLSTIATLALTISCWRRYSGPMALRYSALLLATVLVAPHLTVYDLVILAPAILLVADWIMSRPPTRATGWLAVLLYFVYVLPLLGPLARSTHVQFSVIAMAATLYMMWNLCRSPRSAVTQGWSGERNATN